MLFFCLFENERIQEMKKVGGMVKVTIHIDFVNSWELKLNFELCTVLVTEVCLVFGPDIFFFLVTRFSFCLDLSKNLTPSVVVVNFLDGAFVPIHMRNFVILYELFFNNLEI